MVPAGVNDFENQSSFFSVLGQPCKVIGHATHPLDALTTSCCWPVLTVRPSTCLKARAGRVDKISGMASKSPLPPPVVPTKRPKDDDGGSVVLERRTQRTQPPQMYQVVMLNDDFTPMEFVVVVIQEYFNKDRETATQIMLKIHLDGKGICGVYSRDVAATKVEQVQAAARQAGHPLQCVSEPVE
jgi:ATP-dependent Clp protease adaptor protein ClpS